MMKKIRYVMLLVVLAMVAKESTGQVMDTVVGRDSNYFYQWWTETWFSSDTNHTLFARAMNYLDHQNDTGYYLLPMPNGIALRYNYATRPTWVYGLACSPRAHHILVDTPWKAESVYLYEAAPDTFEMKASAHWRLQDEFHYMGIRMRGYSYNYSDFSGYLCTNNHWNNLFWFDAIAYLPFYEYYFDKPILVQDSFYVGGSFFSNHYITGEELVPYNSPVGTNCWIDPSYSDYWTLSSGVLFDYSSCDSIPGQKYKFWVDPSVAGNAYENLISIPVYGQWFWRDLGKFMMVFPITGLRDSSLIGGDDFDCPGVMNLRLADRSEDCAVLMWDPVAGQDQWQLSVGPSGTLPDDGTFYACYSQVKNLCGLDSNNRYVVYARARCSHRDSLYWSPWSDSLVLAPGASGHSGIDPTSHSSLTVAPNPASDQLTIVSDETVERLTVYDMGGRQVFGENPMAHHITIDVSPWPRGSYFLQAKSRSGVSVRRVVVK